MTEPAKLRQSALGRFAGGLRTPTYDRRRVARSLMHIGVGGFHRAHQAVYLDDLLQATGTTDWGCCGVGLLEQDARMRDVLRSQDGLYTVVERAPGIERARVVGSILEYLYAPDERAGVLARLASPECRLVTLTITEGGYYRHDATGEFDADHPDVAHDLAHPETPRCAFGHLVEALDRRRRAGLVPFSVLSCDNLRHNGDVTRATLLAFAQRRDPSLGRWIAEHVAFPNSMVDRIVPATPADLRDLVGARYGVDDAWPVATEPFRQWIVEDRFTDGRPAWDLVGVQFTNDVTPYETMKMRLLNGSHQALCWIGLLTGHAYAHEAIADPSIRRLVQGLMDDEVTPLLRRPPGIDLDAYKRTLLDRFANPSIGDTLLRIGTDGSARMPKFVLPSIAEQVVRGGPLDALCFTLAAWMHCLGGCDDRGRAVGVVDPMRSRLVEAARAPDPGALLGLRDLVDPTIAGSPRVRALLADLMQSFRAHGARTTLDRFVDARVES